MAGLEPGLALRKSSSQAIASAGERLLRISAFSSTARSHPGFSSRARLTEAAAFAATAISTRPVLYAASATAKCASGRLGYGSASARIRRQVCMRSGSGASSRLSCRNASPIEAPDVAASASARSSLERSSAVSSTISARPAVPDDSDATSSFARSDAGSSSVHRRAACNAVPRWRAASAISVARRASAGSRASRAASR